MMRIVLSTAPALALALALSGPAQANSIHDPQGIDSIDGLLSKMETVQWDEVLDENNVHLRLEQLVDEVDTWNLRHISSLRYEDWNFIVTLDIIDGSDHIVIPYNELLEEFPSRGSFDEALYNIIYKTEQKDVRAPQGVDISDKREEIQQDLGALLFFKNL